MNVRLARAADERAAALAVRHEVFVLEQGVPADLEVDAFDASCDHFVLYDGAAAVGAVRLVIEPAGFAGADPASGPVGHLGRLAVRRDARKSGRGGALVAAVEAHARVLGLNEMALAAQVPAIAFYQKLGYLAYGAEFDDAGLAHRWMRRTLSF